MRMIRWKCSSYAAHTRRLETYLIHPLLFSFPFILLSPSVHMPIIFNPPSPLHNIESPAPEPSCFPPRVVGIQEEGFCLPNYNPQRRRHRGGQLCMAHPTLKATVCSSRRGGYDTPGPCWLGSNVFSVASCA